jgi:DNA-3-methyladenine glycosylase I
MEGGGEWRPPEWMYRGGKRPANDDAYFENMTRIIFQAGLGWKMISEKWPNFKKAFANSSIGRVAKFSDKDVDRLMADKGIVRNHQKILATVHNAIQFQEIKKTYGSFQSFLDKLDKANNYASVIKELGKRFERLGSSSARIFLYSVGENVSHSK